MAKRPPSTIRHSERTYQQIQDLVNWEIGNTQAAVIRVAIDRLWREEKRNHPDVGPVGNDPVTLFYVGAALYLDLESSEVDAILAERGLALAEDNIDECREVIRRARPEAYQAGRALNPAR